MKITLKDLKRIIKEVVEETLAPTFDIIPGSIEIASEYNNNIICEIDIATNTETIIHLELILSKPVVVTEDIGIGPYEFWGFKGRDVNTSPILEKPSEVLSFKIDWNMSDKLVPEQQINIKTKLDHILSNHNGPDVFSELEDYINEKYVEEFVEEEG